MQTDTPVAWYHPDKPNNVINAAQYPHVLEKNKVGYLPCFLAKDESITGNYEFDEEDLRLIKKLRYAIEQYDNGDPIKDFLDEDELIEAGALLLAVIDATQSTKGA